MLLGLTTYSYHLAFGRHGDFHPSKPMDLFGFMDRVVELGLAGFQIDPLHLPQTDAEYLEVLRDEADARGLFIELGAMSVHPEALRDAVRVCRHLGTRILRTFIGFNRFAPSTDVRHELKSAEESIRISLHLLEHSGVTLAVENHGDVTSEELVRLVEEIGNTHVGICLDIGNAVCVLEDPVEAARKMVPFAGSVHLKDYTVIPTSSGCKITGCTLGQGVIPLAEILRIVEDEGVVDRLLLDIPVEPAHGERRSLQHEDHTIRESVAYCRETLGIHAQSVAVE